MGFQMEFIWKFGAKNVEFLTSRMFASSMIRVFPSLEHSAGHVRIPEDNLQDFCVSLAAPDNRWHKCHLYVEQNITARSRCLRRHLPYFQ